MPTAWRDSRRGARSGDGGIAGAGVDDYVAAILEGDMRRWRIGCGLLAWMLATSFGNALDLRLPSTLLVEGMVVGASTRVREGSTLAEALAWMRERGIGVVEIHAGQKLSPRRTDVAVGEGFSEEETEALRDEVVGSGLRVVAARIRFGSSSSAITRLFEWADRLGVRVLVGDPPWDQYDHVERLVRRYDIAVGLPTAVRGSANDGPGAGGRGGWSDPDAVLARLRGRDARMGVVMHTLNLARAGADPHRVVEVLRSRLVGVELVDWSEESPRARAVPFGAGRLDLPRFLTSLHDQGFGGYLVLEPPSEGGESEADLERGRVSIGREMGAIRKAAHLREAGRGVRVAAGLRYEVMFQGDLPEPVHLARCPDGTLWIGSRRGEIRAWSPEARTNSVVARLPASTSGQRGLYRFEFDPEFSSNGNLYVHWAPILASGDSNRVSRFTAVEADGAWRIEADSERVLLDIPSAGPGVQQGGGLLVHPRDGYLYVGTGDQLPSAETARSYDDPRSRPQDVGDLRGKILRIGRDGSVPGENPFVGMEGARPEVFALGLRNPVTLSWDGFGDGRGVLAGDVGYDRAEDFEEVNRIRSGANYGWPRCDGGNRETLSGAGCPLPDVVLPWYAYRHESGAAVMVGPWVEESPSGWGESWSHGVVVSDFSRRTLRWARVDRRTGEVSGTVTLASGLAGGVLSMVLMPSGDLYMVEYGGNRVGSAGDRLSRIVPVGRRR